MKRFAVLVLGLLAISCSRTETPAGKTPDAATAAAKLAGNAAPAAAAPALDPKSLITDDKVSRYMVYQKEMNTVMGLVMGASTGALAKSGGDQKQFEKALSADERTKKIADTEASALAKSGLTRSEVTEMVKIVTPFTAGATVGDDEMKKKAREEFSTKYGPEVLAVLERHLKELSDLQDEMLGAALGGKKK